MCIFAMLGALMFCSKLIMEALPNIHLIGMFTIAFTLFFRAKTLIPIYIFVFLSGLECGFHAYWMPYIYIWAVLWALAMLIPPSAPRWLLCIICPVLCSLHGFLFGVLSAPMLALLTGREIYECIIAGIPYDIPHGIGNAVAGLLIVPLFELLKKLMKKSKI